MNFDTNFNGFLMDFRRDFGGFLNDFWITFSKQRFHEKAHHAAARTPFSGFGGSGNR